MLIVYRLSSLRACSASRSACSGGAGQCRHMAHFPPGAGNHFAIKMQLHIGEGDGARPIGLTFAPQISQQVRHRGGSELLHRAERKKADGSKLLLELAGQICIEGEVSRVVRARRELIDQQAAVSSQRRIQRRALRRLRAFRARCTRSPLLRGQPWAGPGQARSRGPECRSDDGSR